MKKIYLLRHAKSDWDATYDGDFNRPLNRRGKKAAHNVGLHVTDKVRQPEIVLCSSSVRTRHTHKLLVEAANWDCEVEFEDDLYLASPQYVFDRIRSLPDQLSNALVIGHQPTTGIVASALLGGRPIDVPTATFIEIEINSNTWTDVEMGSGRLTQYVLARSLETS